MQHLCPKGLQSLTYSATVPQSIPPSQQEILHFVFLANPVIKYKLQRAMVKKQKLLQTEIPSGREGDKEKYKGLITGMRMVRRSVNTSVSWYHIYIFRISRCLDYSSFFHFFLFFVQCKYSSFFKLWGKKLKRGPRNKSKQPPNVGTLWVQWLHFVSKEKQITD